MVLERIDLLVFYFKIECKLCHNVLSVSHVAMEEQKGEFVCSLCGKSVKIPDCEKLVGAAKTLNAYLGDKQNASVIRLTLNDKFVVKDEAPAPH